MATLLDMGLLQEFSSLFPIILVLVLAYAFLLKAKYFAENKGAAFLLAGLLGIMVAISPVANRAIQLMAPYYVILFIGVFFIVLSMMILGADEKLITNYVFGDARKGTWASWTVGVVAMLIAVGGFFKALAEESMIPGLGGQIPEGLSAQETLFFEIIFHPKVMGMILVLVVVIFTINRLAAETVE